jgi:flagellum-specific peptidoglycan hydrolase FlgJ
LAQAALETGYGRAVIGKANYWGIKKLSWISGSVAVPTHEWNPLTKQSEPAIAYFADFAGPQEAFDAYGRLVSNSPTYQDARDAGDLESYVEALAGHWASDPQYAAKVMLIIGEHNLATLDEPL